MFVGAATSAKVGKPAKNGPRAVLGSQRPQTPENTRVYSNSFVQSDALRAEDGSRSGYHRNPASCINFAVPLYASSTHSTIFFGSGAYSSSMETAPSILSSLIACTNGANFTTPRPGGKSPCTLPSQSLRCT